MRVRTGIVGKVVEKDSEGVEKERVLSKETGVSGYSYLLRPIALLLTYIEALTTTSRLIVHIHLSPITISSSIDCQP